MLGSSVRNSRETVQDTATGVQGRIHHPATTVDGIVVHSCITGFKNQGHD
jgi:hypothetical protein